MPKAEQLYDRIAEVQPKVLALARWRISFFEGALTVLASRRQMEECGMTIVPYLIGVYER